jgi:hypothetical protein
MDNNNTVASAEAVVLEDDDVTPESVTVTEFLEELVNPFVANDAQTLSGCGSCVFCGFDQIPHRIAQSTSSSFSSSSSSMTANSSNANSNAESSSTGSETAAELTGIPSMGPEFSLAANELNVVVEQGKATAKRRKMVNQAAAIGFNVLLSAATAGLALRTWATAAYQASRVLSGSQASALLAAARTTNSMSVFAAGASNVATPGAAAVTGLTMPHAFRQALDRFRATSAFYLHSCIPRSVTSASFAQQQQAPIVIYAFGFCNQSMREQNVQTCRRLTAALAPILGIPFSNILPYYLHWESGSRNELFPEAGNTSLANSSPLGLILQGIASSSVPIVGDRLAVAYNDWKSAVHRSHLTAKLLANLIANCPLFKGRKVYLVGHSLGARVAYKTLRHLTKARKMLQQLVDTNRIPPTIADSMRFDVDGVLMFGAAAPNDKLHAWREAAASVKQPSTNFVSLYCKKDNVLSTMYLGTCLSFAAGHICIPWPADQQDVYMRQLDASSVVSSHTGYWNDFPKVVQWLVNEHGVSFVEGATLPRRSSAASVNNANANADVVAHEELD